MNYVMTVLVGLFLATSAFGERKKTVPQKVEDDVNTILATAEEIRSPKQAEIFVNLVTTQAKQKTSYEMKILRSTERRAHIDFLGPKEERGRRMLAQGNRYWSTFPSSRRVVAISRKEMIGNSAFALADIFQMDAEKDYNAKIVERTTIAKKAVLKLQLDAKHEDSPYFKIFYWVEVDGYYPVQAEFYGFSGNLLKTMTVGPRKKLAGRERPESLIMKDEVIVGRRSVWNTQKMRQYQFPDHVFTKEYLKKQ